jgi:hypothetical protein
MLRARQHGWHKCRRRGDVVCPWRRRFKREEQRTRQPYRAQDVRQRVGRRVYRSAGCCGKELGRSVMVFGHGGILHFVA